MLPTWWGSNWQPSDCQWEGSSQVSRQERITFSYFSIKHVAGTHWGTSVRTHRVLLRRNQKISNFAEHVIIFDIFLGFDIEQIKYLSLVNFKKRNKKQFL